MNRLPLILLALLLSSPAWAASATVDGTLRGKNGAPLADTEVELQDGQGKIVGKTSTDAKGRYTFNDIAQGSYVLQAVRKNAVLGSTHLSVADSAPAHKNLDLAEAQTLNVVIGQRRAEMRNSLSPTTGTSAYKLDAQAIAALPQGDDTSLNKIMLQAPGVAEDSAASGNLHIRGEHGNVQYRLNGILLPDGISGFGDTIDPHIVESATLLDGALPAQYGFHTAGVVDIDTKTGFVNGGTATMTVGSNGTIQPSISYGGTAGSADYFIASSHLSSDLGIENPTSSANAIHDHTEQNKQFGYASYMINPMQRAEVVAGNSISYYQIPNNPGQSPFQLNGVNAANPSNLTSASLNERQFESNQYATGAWQGENDGVTVQIAPFIRNSETHFRPDTTGDLLFDGLASDVQYTDLATGLQNDNSWRVNAEHTLRAGFSAQNDHVQNDTASEAYLTDASGNFIPSGSGDAVSQPIVNDHTKDGQLYGLYLQDEWKLTDRLTMNYGARFDDMEQYVSANQLSPRLGFVYKATDTTTLHAGYARYFTPPPMELVSNGDIAAFAGTSAAPAETQNDAVKPERSHNFDIGATQKLGERWQVGLDGYYKLVHDLLDEGQFGPALILTPFNYQRGYIYGSELTANYTGEKLKAYGNLAFSRAMGENIVSSQFNFSDPDELAYISDHYVHLDHDQTFTASAGASYDVREGTTLGLDMISGSGLRDGFANTSHLPAYATFNASVEQKLNLFPHDETAVRLSVVNLMDSAYELRSGTGIGVGAPQWGARRGVFVSVAQKF
ncbi:MAG: TonB-dependent receptor [Alphaproteobacteria bacterium]|nr:TonB-dependent receptor [Alphaproteobacteria bacterium]